jgi:hypothetical protein
MEKPWQRLFQKPLLSGARIYAMISNSSGAEKSGKKLIHVVSGSLRTTKAVGASWPDLTLFSDAF